MCVCVRQGEESERQYSAVESVDAGASGCGARAPAFTAFSVGCKGRTLLWPCVSCQCVRCIGLVATAGACNCCSCFFCACTAGGWLTARVRVLLSDSWWAVALVPTCAKCCSTKYNDFWWGLQHNVCLCCVGCGSAWGVCIMVPSLLVQQQHPILMACISC